MNGHWVRVCTPTAAEQNLPVQRARRITVEPALPALIRGITFLAALATPFVAALLIR